MSVGDLQGYARTSLRDPFAKGECDRCRFWWPLDALQRQFEWRGAYLADTGYLVCRRCLDTPQEQFRTIILPADPYPRVNPRPSPDITGYAIAGSVAVPTSPGNLGFSQYVLGSPAWQEDYPNVYTGVPPSRTHLPGLFAVVDQVAAVSGVPTPAKFFFNGIIITQQNVPQVLLHLQPTRGFLIFYNPSTAPAQVALATEAVWGMTTNLAVGPGEAFFWATAQGLGPCYTGPLSVISQQQGIEFWCFTDVSRFLLLQDLARLQEQDSGFIPLTTVGFVPPPIGPTGLINNGGVLCLSDDTGWPQDDSGAPGTVWSNGGVCSIVPGFGPSPVAPVYFGMITSAELLALGGVGLPDVSVVTAGSQQLYNSGSDEIWIA